MAEEENVAAVLHGKRDIRVERSAPPTLAAHEVLLEIKAVGLCGSDFSYWKDATIAGMDIPFEGAARCQDMCFAGVMGHEASGRVARVGSAVQGVAVGDRVAIEPSITCGACRHCLGGRYNLCAETKYLGSFMSDWPGALRKFISHPASRCYVLPESIGYEEAALFEPLGVALHAVRRAGVKMGDRVLVTGAGPIGLLAMLAARCAGATQIAVADINAQRLALAAGLEGGADQTLLLPAQAAELEQDSYDVALECTGVASWCAPPAPRPQRLAPLRWTLSCALFVAVVAALADLHSC